LQLPQTLLDETIRQALAEKPNECCGLFAGVREDGPTGRVGRVVRRYPLVNALASPTEFEGELRSLKAAYADMDANALHWLAVYHSHPTSPAVPSRKDLARHPYSEVMCLIVSLAADPPSVRCWWLTETEAREAEWEVLSEKTHVGPAVPDGSV
jgi:proteasome lid subunit RPN8/RPN11